METFLVRIATPVLGPKDAEPPELRGVVEQLGAKRSHPFCGGDELLRLLGGKRTSVGDEDA